MKFTKTYFVVLSAIQAVFFALPAFSDQPTENSTARIRQDLRAQSIQLIGRLSCKMTGTNAGQSCALRIQEEKSGKTYNLINANNAMKLYFNGITQVSIEGSFQDNETLTVASVKAL
jgi:hypothetical protein